MINSFKEYKTYRIRENIIKANLLKRLVFPEPTDTFLRWLRRVEWHYNSKGIAHKVFFIIAYFFYRRISIKSGISISKNVCDIGLSLPHFGSIVVNSNCKIGKNCRIHNNVNIGASGGSSRAPIIGDNVYIGPGAVLFGDIQIADNCFIGANAVVNRSFLEPYSLIVGVPATVVKKIDKAWNE